VTYTIFINDKPFVITDDWDYLIHDPSYLHHYNDNRENVVKITREFVDNTRNRGLILHASNSLKAFESFCSDYQLVEAAGGIVENEKEQVLLIHRKGRWDLPKGKIEKNETETEAAKREVMEECGLQHVVTGAKLTTTYHTFFMTQHRVLKISHWYKMQCSSEEALKPQLEEDITEIKWFVKSLLDPNKLDTYKSITQVLKLYLKTRQ
jgi:ADP-ribose pyrophosphatase YjhB (NUDIX family)